MHVDGRVLPTLLWKYATRSHTTHRKKARDEARCARQDGQDGEVQQAQNMMFIHGAWQLSEEVALFMPALE